MQKFSFDVKNEIKVVPPCKSVNIKPSDGSSFLIEFIPKAMGFFREKMLVDLDNGKKVCIVVKCNVIPVNIFLSKFSSRLFALVSQHRFILDFIFNPIFFLGFLREILLQQ